MFGEPSLFAEDNRPVASQRQLKRQRTHPCDDLIRKVKGQRFQVRIWLAKTLDRPGVSVNCGLYQSEEEAIAAKDELLAFLSETPRPWSPENIWKSITLLIRERIIPGRVLPLWVKRVKEKQGESSGGGGRYFAKVKLGGVVLRSEAFGTAEEAHEAMSRLVAGLMANKRALRLAAGKGTGGKVGLRKREPDLG